MRILIFTFLSAKLIASPFATMPFEQFMFKPSHLNAGVSHVSNKKGDEERSTGAISIASKHFGVGIFYEQFQIESTDPFYGRGVALMLGSNLIKKWADLTIAFGKKSFENKINNQFNENFAGGKIDFMLFKFLSILPWYQFSQLEQETTETNESKYGIDVSLKVLGIGIGLGNAINQYIEKKKPDGYSIRASFDLEI